MLNQKQEFVSLDVSIEGYRVVVYEKVLLEELNSGHTY